jgi:hypothetical protein
MYDFVVPSELMKEKYKEIAWKEKIFSNAIFC